MDQLLNNLVKYLTEVTGLGVTATPMPSDNLPYFFTRQYALYHLVIGGTSFTAAFLQDETDFKPVQFIKHMRQVPLLEIDSLCVVAHSLPTYVRKRLIEKGISFIIPGVQMYLPALVTVCINGLSFSSNWIIQPLMVWRLKSMPSR